MTEKWKAIPGYAGAYEVSDMGRVRSYLGRGVVRPRPGHPPRIMPQRLNSNGYMRVYLKDQKCLVHRLVMCSFVGHSDLEVNHKNADRTDNRLANLEYMTLRDNRRYPYDVLGKEQKGGTKGEGAANAKLTESDVICIRSRYKSGETVDVLHEEYNIARSTCIRVINGKAWKHVPGAIKMYNRRYGQAARERMTHHDDE